MVGVRKFITPGTGCSTALEYCCWLYPVFDGDRTVLSHASDAGACVKGRTYNESRGEVEPSVKSVCTQPLSSISS